MTLNLSRTFFCGTRQIQKISVWTRPRSMQWVRAHLEVRYSRIGLDADLIKPIAGPTGGKAVLFTRHNGTVGQLPVGRLLAKLRMGYTCICGIDAQQQKEQTTECIQDFLSGHGRVDIPPVQSDCRGFTDRSTGKGTFSLILDFEQLGGARFGLPPAYAPSRICRHSGYFFRDGLHGLALP